MMIVGGRGRIWGPILGTIALAVVDESFRDLAQWRNTAFAVVLMIMLVFVPEGLAGRLGRFSRVWTPLVDSLTGMRDRRSVRS